jgi:hypothetical protein
MKKDVLDARRYYQNRHVEWLEFNRRVLEEARDPGNPLLERVKFSGDYCEQSGRGAAGRCGVLRTPSVVYTPSGVNAPSGGPPVEPDTQETSNAAV